MQDMVKRYHEANNSFCSKCSIRRTCCMPCPTFIAHVHNVSLFEALERIVTNKVTAAVDAAVEEVNTDGCNRNS